MYYYLLSCFLLYCIFGFLFNFWMMKFSLVFNRESKSYFECGFDSNSKSRSMFSVRFFLLMILFLVFDVELTYFLHFPFVAGFFWLNRWVCYWMMMILFVGVFEEYRRGILNWKY